MWWRRELQLMLSILSLHEVTYAQSFEIQVRLIRYQNEYHKDVNSSCCRSDCNEDCLSSLRFCLRDIADDSGSCSGGQVEFNIESDDILFGYLEEAVGSTSSGSNVLNPLSFEVPMGSYQLEVGVRNREAGSEIANFSGNYLIAESGNINMESNQSYQIMSSGIKLSYTYQVQCGVNYNGPNCTEAGAQLSGGAIAGIVIPLFLVLLIASAGMTTGLLLWKYQPWDNCSVKASGTDAMNNPVYELNMVDGSTPAQKPAAAKAQVTVSMESSPLYASAGSVGGTLENNLFVENQNLLSVLRMPSRSKSLEPEVEESVKDTIQHSHSAMGIHAYENHNKSSGSAIVQDTSPGSAIVQDTSSRNPVVQDGNGTVAINVYGSYRDSVSFPTANNNGGMTGVSGTTFDDPDYDDVDNYI